MKLKHVIKRSGIVVDYDPEKIYNAIAGASKAVNDSMTTKEIKTVANLVEDAIANWENINVEDIQDVVEKTLMEQNFYEVAKRYIMYRQRHAARRDAQKHLMNSYRDIFFADAVDSDMKRDNANINTDASMGIMLKLGAEGAKHFVDNYMLPEEFAKADRENYIHIHDKDFSLITLNCCQIDLLKLFHGGFSTGHGFLREPNSIRAYASLACIAIQSNQNDMFGGQSINAFDYAMAEGVTKTYKKALAEEAYKACLYRFGANDLFTAKSFRQMFVAAMDYTRCPFTDGDPIATDTMCQAIADALEKIEYYATHARPMQDASPATAHMFIINPLKGAGKTLANLFSTHPDTSERIALLRQQAREMRIS